MLYQHKKSKEVVHLVYSDADICVYIAAIDLTKKKGPEDSIGAGIVFKGNKKEFKKEFKKASSKQKKIYRDVPQDALEQVLDIIKTDKYGLVNHTNEYLLKDIEAENEYYKDFHKNMTEEEYEKMLEELKD